MGCVHWTSLWSMPSYFILETAMSFYVDQDHCYWQVKYEDLNVGMQLTWGWALEPERKSSIRTHPSCGYFWSDYKEALTKAMPATRTFTQRCVWILRRLAWVTWTLVAVSWNYSNTSATSGSHYTQNKSEKYVIGANSLSTKTLGHRWKLTQLPRDYSYRNY